MAVSPELHPTSFSGGERGLGPGADLLPLMLGERREQVQHELRGMRFIDRDEIDAALHQIRDERHIAGEPVELGYKQGSLLALAGCERGLQLRPVIALPTFDFRELGYERPVGLPAQVLA